MANTVIKPSDVFPVGSTVVVYTVGSDVHITHGGSGSPSSAGATGVSAIVAADGSLTFAGLTSGRRYIATGADGQGRKRSVAFVAS